MKILSSEMAQHYQMNSLLRGHLVFTSFISCNGKILFLEAHIERLLKGAEFLFPNCNWAQNFLKIKQHVENEFIKINDQTVGNFYFRLTIFDENIFLLCRPPEGQACSDSLRLMSAQKIKTTGLIPPFLKVSNYLESDLELERARLKNFDDIIFFDEGRNLTEASSSNVFMVDHEGVIITPMPSSNILDGVTRKKLLEKLRMLGFEIKEAAISKSDLLNAREIWLTNSLKGIRFASQFEDSFFEKKDSVFLKAIKVFGRYGELA
jgi:branched-subunit amino acid aminotransferase/4-amino-4-deoxychorismate lyase